MPITEAILDGVVLNDMGIDFLESISYDEELGFLKVEEAWRSGDKRMVRIAGFAVSGWEAGTTDLDNQFSPYDNFRDMPETRKKVAVLGKGAGARVYNTAQAHEGTEERPEAVGLYMVDIDLAQGLDYRRALDHTFIGKSLRVVRHASMEVAAKVMDDVSVINLNEKRYKGRSALFYNQTVAAERQKADLGLPASAVPEQLVIIRPPAELFLLGTYHRETADS